MSKNYFLTLLALFLFSSIYAQNFPIGNANFSFNDPTRANRSVTGTVYYPATSTGTNQPVANGQFPIIVLGHGFLIPISEYDIWWNGLVPEGYILILPDTEGGILPSHGDFGDDMSFLVDTYLALNTSSGSNFFQKLNGKAAVMGHSMGGGSSFLAASSNSNVTTQVSLAAAETNPSAIAAAGGIAVPALVLAGSLDCVSPPSSNQIPMYNALSSSYKAYIEITNGTHCQFSKATPFAACDIGESCSGNAISDNSQHAQMLNATLPWFDYWLKCECGAWSVFQNYLTTTSTHTYQDAGTQPTVTYPSGVASSGVTGTTAMISWSAVPGTSQYYVCYRTVGTSNWMTTTTTGTSINLSGLTGSTTYEYIVSADCIGCDDPNAPVNTFSTTGGTTCYNNLNQGNGLPSTETGVADYESSNWIESNAVIQSGARVDYDATLYIQLNAGFTVNVNAIFNAFIDGCDGGGGGVNLTSSSESTMDK